MFDFIQECGYIILNHYVLEKTITDLRASLVAQLVKNPPTSQETPVRFLGQEDPLEKWIGYPLQYSWTSLMAQLVKNPPAMWEAWVQTLGWEDPLEKGEATHSSILVWRILWTE